MSVDPKIKDFFTDMVSRAEPFFRDPRERLYVEREDGKLAAVGFTASGTLLFRAEAKQELAEFDTIACFGALRYLKGILEHPKIANDGTLSINTRKASNGQPAVHQLVFYSRRSQFTYQCHDPFLNAPTRKKGTSHAKSIDFEIGADTIKEFEDVVRVHSTSEDDGDLFSVSLADNRIVAEFGTRGSQARIVLAETFTDEVQAPLSVLFEKEQFRDVLKVCRTGASVNLMPLGIQLEVPTPTGLYSFAMRIRKPPE